jgi:hypothetical protein
VSIDEDEVHYIGGLFSDGGGEKSKRILHSNIQFLRKSYSKVLSDIGIWYARYLAYKAIKGAAVDAVDKKLIQLLFDDQGIENFYNTFITALSPVPHNESRGDEYAQILDGAEAIFIEIKTALKLARHDEMLANSLYAQIGTGRLDESLAPACAVFFRWAAKVSNNWPMVATALLSGNRSGLELQKAQKASAGSACRMAMSYLINPRDITSNYSAMVNTLATVLVQDTYTLKLTGLVLHNRKDRNLAIEKLYKITQDERLLELMSDVSLESTLGSDLGL